MFFILDSIGWIVGFNGVILHTRNKGSIWETQASPTQHELRSLTFINQDKREVFAAIPDALPHEFIDFEAMVTDLSGNQTHTMCSELIIS